MRRTFLFFILVLAAMQQLWAQQATWIWYPGDFEIWLGNQMQNRRTERFAFVPPFWRVYSHNPQVNFSKNLDLAQPETITVAVEGRYNVTIDGRYVQQSDQEHITIPAGKHNINFQVFNQAAPPAVFVQGNTLFSDPSWTVELVHNNSSENLPGKAKNGQAGSWNFNNPAMRPSAFQLPVKEVRPIAVEQKGNSVLVDFGQETFGFVQLKNVKGKGRLSLFYGESKEEALSEKDCETFDHFTIANTGDFTSGHSRAMRYVHIVADPSLSFDSVALQYEYLPLAHRGAFRSSDEELNRIWQVAERTLELNTREFFLDGIKRDRWVWAGDAVQSYLMNFYTFFDNETVKRTTWALRGADPVEAHINTINDYSLYWFTGIYDYYLYTGDTTFLQSVYPRMVSLMDFVLKRTNTNGMIEGLPGDWVFIDWAPMSKEGELSAMQLLFARSLEAMGVCARLMGDGTNAARYNNLAKDLKQKIMTTFWDAKKGAFIHGRNKGKRDTLVTRYANMFAMMFGYLTPAQVASVNRNVLMNDQVLKITTPYMRFYELAALAETGNHNYVYQEMKNYWGGMLREGATSFWEAYDPKEQGDARYAMYGRPFGKSLCHAWGASPLYLLGKYYLGVKPTKPGYAAFEVAPHLGGLEWIEGMVPAPGGDIAVYASNTQLKVKCPIAGGTLRFASSTQPRSNKGNIKSLGNKQYELVLEKDYAYSIDYTVLTQ